MKKLLEVDGVKLRELRRDRALAQEDLERMTGVAQSTLSALEAGKRDAQPRTVRKLAEALGVEPRELMRRGGDE
jgi:transcriptional regulator with XRE-family HTH domain